MQVKLTVFSTTFIPRNSLSSERCQWRKKRESFRFSAVIPFLGSITVVNCIHRSLQQSVQSLWCFNSYCYLQQWLLSLAACSSHGSLQKSSQSAASTKASSCLPSSVSFLHRSPKSKTWLHNMLLHCRWQTDTQASHVLEWSAEIRQKRSSTPSDHVRPCGSSCFCPISMVERWSHSH